MSLKIDTMQPVRQFVVQNFLFGKDEGLTGDQSFLDTGIVDSTGVLELVAFLESTYGIKINDDELAPENLDSLINISKFLQAKLEP